MKDVVIIGAGLAGLNCALTLERAGFDLVLLEAADAAGGRVRTDRFDGFLLDRGFQVLLTAYPEAEQVFDYPALKLKSLKPGALVWQGGRFHRFADPFREPLAAMRLAVDPVVTFGDKLRVAGLRELVSRGSVDRIFAHPETTTQSFLESFPFSPKIIERFFRPFFGGVFLEKELVTSSRYFEFLFRMFSTGAVAVPAAGMQQLPEQLAGRLKPGTLVTSFRADNVDKSESGFAVWSEDGRSFSGKRVVVAVAEYQLPTLMRQFSGAQVPVTWNRTTTLYFASDRAPVSDAILVLNGDGDAAGPVNNAVVMSNVSSDYAPAGKHLISASVVGHSPQGSADVGVLEEEVRRHLESWFGANVAQWRFLKAYAIDHALPLQRTAKWESGEPRTGVQGVYRAGDFVETASIQGALAAGRRAAEALLSDAL